MYACNNAIAKTFGRAHFVKSQYFGFIYKKPRVLPSHRKPTNFSTIDTRQRIQKTTVLNEQ